MSKLQLEIGQTVWYFNENRRVYAAGSPAPVWREHWEPMTVSGETSRSYLLDRGRVKLAKTQVADEQWAFSLEDIERAQYVADRHFIARRVSMCRDYEVLRAIAALLEGKGKQS